MTIDVERLRATAATAPVTFALRKIGHVVLMVSDLQRATEFYTQVLGFQVSDGHNLEIYWGIDRIGTEGISRPAHEWRGAKSLEEALANPPRGEVPVLHDRSLLE